MASETRGSQVSRRQALGRIATGAVGLAAGATLSAPFVHASGKRKLSYACNGVTAFPQIARRAREDLGIEIEFNVYSNEDLLKLAVTQPNSLDLLEIAFDSLPFLIDLNKIRGIDARNINFFDEISPVFIPGNKGATPRQADGRSPRDLCHVTKEISGGPTSDQSGWLAAIPVTFNADSLGVRVPSQATGIPTHWRALLAPEFAGHAAITGIPSVGIIDAAMALESRGDHRYANKSEMTHDDITFTVNRLIDFKKKDHFRGIWHTFSESVDLMTNKEVVIQSMWFPAITRTRLTGIDCRMADFEEGYRGWARGLTLPRNLSQYKTDMAYDVFNWYLDGFPGSVISRQGYYSAVPKKTKDHLSADEWGYWYEGKTAEDDILSPAGDVVEQAGTARTGGSMADRIGKIACWNSFMRDHSYLRREWQRFLEA
ncbi:ABC transporter substrate-binding protein [Aestuariispira ectoiniformans]|uniref:ABC transporter substrate-binding protein n=1 Tax=Aestuariispira ectoiniformans TaxID=2775080 RepID=UPI00223B7045|nr:ABC transporter substrate-binding protein [Aestuariispira ectoiniformans]